MRNSVKAEGKNTSCSSNKRFIKWLPERLNNKLTKKEREWFKENSNWKPGFAPTHRCSLLNAFNRLGKLKYNAIKKYEKYKRKNTPILI